MLRQLSLAVPAVLALAGSTSAQIRPVTVITGRPAIVVLPPQANPIFASPYSLPPIYNPAPTFGRPLVLPATWSQPAVIPPQLTPWGVQPAQLIPGVFTPPQVATVEPSLYVPVAQWTAINPVNGNVYDAWNQTFTNRDGTYRYNPWTNAFVDPYTSATYNPNSGVTVRPLGPIGGGGAATSYSNFYNRYPQPTFFR